MKAALKGFSSIDIVEKLQDYQPIDKENFSFLGTFYVGEKDIEGEDNFDVFVCTPKWLLENTQKDDVIFGRHYIIVSEYNYDTIYQALKKEIDSIEEDNWDKIGEKIGRIGHWEFEDYQEYPSQTKTNFISRLLRRK